MERRVQADDASLWTVSDGTGPPIVWCHGGPGIWDYLQPVARMHAGRQVIRYDQRACGRSTGGGPFTVAQAIADLDAVREHFELETWTVAGHSWGAMLALHYALRYPERVERVIYLSGIGAGMEWHATFKEERKRRYGTLGLQKLSNLERLWDEEGTIEAERAYCTESWASDFVDLELGRRLAPSLFVDALRINGDVNRELWADHQRLFTRENLQPRLAQLHIPVMAIHGDHDPRPAYSVSQLCSYLPHAEFRLLENAGHMPWLDAPEQLQELL